MTSLRGSRQDQRDGHEYQREDSLSKVWLGSRVSRRIRAFFKPLGGWLFVLPSIVAVGVVFGLPLVNVVRYSFTDRTTGLSDANFVGLDNYQQLLTSDAFQRVLVNQVVLAVAIVLWVVVPYILAIVTRDMAHRTLIRTLLFIPALLPPVMAGRVFRLVFDGDGPITGALELVGLESVAPQWLSNDPLVLITVIIMLGWATMGVGVLFYSAGLASIPPEIEDAALVDGANWFQLVWHVLRPALRPVTRLWVLLLTIATVTRFFPWIYSLTEGGPGVASTTLDYYVYDLGIRSGQGGLGSAAAVINIGFVVVLIGCELLLGRAWSRR